MSVENNTTGPEWQTDEFGNQYYDYYGYHQSWSFEHLSHDEWGFLMICAGWFTIALLNDFKTSKGLAAGIGLTYLFFQGLG